MAVITWSPCLLAVVVLVSVVTASEAFSASFPPKQVLVPGMASSPLTRPPQAFGDMCRKLCTGSSRFVTCPIRCRMAGLYSNKRNFGGFFDFSSRERDRAQSFDDKMFMELLGRKYDDMA